MQRTLFVAASLALIATSIARSQGSLADYQRADTMQGSTRGLVLNERLDPVWLPDGNVLVKIVEPDGHRFITIHAATGKRRDAFDHDAAAALAGAGVVAARLPIRSIHVNDTGRLQIEIDGAEAHTLTAHPDGSDLRDDPDTTRPTLESTDARRSHTDGPEVFLTFVNESEDATVSIEWVGFDGAPRKYGTLAPGESRRQHTFAGHVWRVVALPFVELGRYRAPRQDAIVRFDGVVRASTPQVKRADHAERSSDGSIAAVVDSDNIAIRTPDDPEPIRLTTDGTPENSYTRRMSFSPDATRLAVIRRLPGQERRVHLVEAAPEKQLQPAHHTYEYLKPGDRTERVRPHLFDIDARTEIPVDDALFDNPWSINAMRWTTDGSELLFIYHERGHQVRRVIGVDRDTGTARAIIDERAATFIDYSQKTHLTYLSGSDELLWMSERDGWNHLYLYDRRSGDLRRQLTSGPWVVRDVMSVDEGTHTVTFKAMGVFPSQDPYHVHVGRVGVDDGIVTWLTEGDGTHEIVFGPEGTLYLDTWSRVDHPPVHELRRVFDGALVTEIVRADWSALVQTGWRSPERFRAKGRDGTTDIWGVIFTPTIIDPAQACPVIEQIYAGPHGHHVPKRFNAWHGARAMAEFGFVVVQIDGMGTNWRSKAFHDLCWKNIGDAGFPDRIAWITAAAEARPYMDLARVGIYGGSAGGQNAMRTLLFHNDFYRAAVADCGCHDNRMDKIWWNEAWMGWPVDESYEASSNVVHAHRLEGDLLLIVGAMDRNVDPSSTMQVVQALIDADKDFELLVMPSAGHGAAGTPYGTRRQRDFFVRRLLGREPRWE